MEYVRNIMQGITNHQPANVAVLLPNDPVEAVREVMKQEFGALAKLEDLLVVRDVLEDQYPELKSLWPPLRYDRESRSYELNHSYASFGILRSEIDPFVRFYRTDRIKPLTNFVNSLLMMIAASCMMLLPVLSYRTMHATVRDASIALLNPFAGMDTLMILYFDTGKSCFAKVVAAFTRSRRSIRKIVCETSIMGPDSMATFLIIITQSKRNFQEIRTLNITLRYL
jgi:hypothetical protein